MNLIKRLIPWLGDVARATVFPTYGHDSKRGFALVYFVRLVFLVVKRLFKDRCPRQAAALSFQTMLSIVPLAAVTVSIISAFDLEKYLERLTYYLEANLLPESAGKAGAYIMETAGSVQLKTLGLVGGISLVVIASALLFNVEQTVNEVFRATTKRLLLRRFLSVISLLIGVPVGFGLSIYFTKDLLVFQGLTPTLVPLLFSILSLFLCYWLLPRPEIKIKYAAISAAIAGVAFEALKIGFAFYARHLGTTLSYVYGTFAILPLFMAWNYMAWMIFLFGAELNASLHEVKRHDRFEKFSAPYEPSE